LTQRLDRRDLADATPKPAATQQRDKRSAGLRNMGFVGERVEDFAPIGRYRYGPPRHFQEHFFLAITE
jgi:hypothetical protein